MRLRTGMTGLVTVACASVFLAPVPAVAAQAPQGEATASHCVGDLDTGKTTCYDTFRESVAAATGGRVTDATQKTAAKDKNFPEKLNASTGTGTARAANASHVIGVFYWDANYSGPTWIARAANPCYNNGRWDWRWTGLGDWNDAISSIQLAGNCYIRGWEHGDYSGATQYYTSDTTYVGNAMNDRISALEFN
ncbi:hypothetical protein AB0G74_27005 [Streptomyces sp. NPDC020875]|uniref:hypothetical protein n=1 Tax=Streptomyces sp. NPDC020875 TaxID=3154898 RepID=UPI0033CC3062